MHISALSLLPLTLLAPRLTQSSSSNSNSVEGQDGNCSSCGWFCNQGCDASLNQTDCARCQLCRRESSSCGFWYIRDTWTHDPPSDDLCNACAAGCWCYGDWYCTDDGSTPVPSPSPSNTGEVPRTATWF